MKKLVGILFLVLSFSSFAQKKDSTLQYPIHDYYDYTDKKDSPLNLNPSGLETEVKFNPETGMYEIYQTIGGIQYRYPTAMTLEEYLEWSRKEALKKDMMDKINKENEQEHSNNPIPALKIKNEAFDVIFGGDEINIRPQGSA